MTKSRKPSSDFWGCVDTGNGIDSCWEWQAARDSNGYGRFGKSQRTHRLVLEMAGVDIPKGSHVHHVCENTSCCNPLHLEVMAHSEHARMTALRKPVRLVCSHGHWVIGENVYRRKSRGRENRACRVCIRDGMARHQEKVLGDSETVR